MCVNRSENTNDPKTTCIPYFKMVTELDLSECDRLIGALRQYISDALIREQIKDDEIKLVRKDLNGKFIFNQELQNQREKHLKTISTLEDEASRKDEKIQGLSDEIDHLKREQSDSIKDNLNLRNKVVGLIEDKNRQTEAHQTFEEEAKNILETLTNEKAELQNDLLTLNEDSSRKDEKIKALKDEIDLLKQEQNHVNEDNADLRNKVAHLIEDKNRQFESNKKFKEELSEKDEKIKGLKDKNARLKVEMSGLKRKLSRAKQDNVDLGEKVSKVAREKAEKMAEIDQKNKSLLSRLRRWNANLKREKDELEIGNETKRKQIDARNKTIQELKLQLTKLADKIKEQMNPMQQELAKFLEEQKRNQVKLSSFCEKIQQQGNENESLQKENELLKGQIETLNRKRHEEKLAFERANEKFKSDIQLLFG